MPLTEERKRNLLSDYDKQRGRIVRGAQVALVTGGLASFTGQKKLAPRAAAAGALLGYGDKALEEKSKKAQEAHMSKVSSNYGPRDDGTLLSSGSKESEQETFQGVLETLFSQKGRKAALSDKQLGALFPKANTGSYGHSLRAGLGAREASKRTAAAFRVK